MAHRPRHCASQSRPSYRPLSRRLAPPESRSRFHTLRRDCMLAALQAKTGNRLLAEAPAGGMQMMVRYDGRRGDRQLSLDLLNAGIVSRPVSSMSYGKSNEQGLLLGFAAWNEREIERAAHTLGRILR